MEFDEFERACQEIGGQFSEEYEGEVAYCENDRGEQIWFRDFETEDGHYSEVNFENVDFQVEDGYNRDTGDLRFDGDAIVLEDTPIYSQTSMYGGSTNRGDLRFTGDGVRVESDTRV